jgi:hypothetical protein
MRVVMASAKRSPCSDYGKKIAEGTPQEIRSNPKVIAAYLGRTSTMLEIRDLHVNYGRDQRAPRHLAESGEGENRHSDWGEWRGEIDHASDDLWLGEAAGRLIQFESHDISGMPPHVIVGLGIAQVPRDAWSFANLTVLRICVMGRTCAMTHQESYRTWSMSFVIFPRLKGAGNQTAGNTQRWRAANAGDRRALDEQTEVPDAR